MVHPTPNRLIGHRHAAFRQQIFDVAQAEGEPEVEPYRLVNDLRRETISGVADFLHPLGYSAMGRTASPTRRDNAAEMPLGMLPRSIARGVEQRRRRILSAERSIVADIHPNP